MLADAVRADATGTLFLYAADKRDLLILTVNEDLDRLTADDAAHTTMEKPFLDQLTGLFRPRYVYWAIDRRLALKVLQEVQETHGSDYAPGSAMAHFQEHRDLIVRHLTRLVEARQRAGDLDPGESAATLAALIMLIYATAVRYWLRGPETSVDEGIAVLRDYLRISLGGTLRKTNENSPAS